MMITEGLEWVMCADNKETDSQSTVTTVCSIHSVPPSRCTHSGLLPPPCLSYSIVIKDKEKEGMLYSFPRAAVTVLQTRWLKTMEISSLTVLRLGVEFSLASSQELPLVAGRPCPSLAYSCLPPVSASVLAWCSSCVPVPVSKCSSFYKVTSHIGLKVHLTISS